MQRPIEQQTRYPAEMIPIRSMDVTPEAIFFRELSNGVLPDNFSCPIVTEPPFLSGEIYMFEHFLHACMR